MCKKCKIFLLHVTSNQDVESMKKQLVNPLFNNLEPHPSAKISKFDEKETQGIKKLETVTGVDKMAYR